MKKINKVWMILALFCLNITVFAQTLTIEKSNITVKQAMEELKKQSGYSFVFSSIDVNTKKAISISVEDGKIDEAIEQILVGQGLTYELLGKNIIVKKATSTKQVKGVKKKITGTVVDNKGETIIGATVLIKGTTNGVSTDLDGAFSIVVEASDILVVSYIGYNTKELTVGTNSVLSIQLEENIEALDEVVVVGYGTMRKRDLTGAIGAISGGDLAERKSINVSNALQGAISGVMVTRPNGAPGSTGTIRIRGITSIGDDASDPLIIVDGVPVESIDQVNSNDIESLSILKDAASAAIYGSRAAAGVVLITTKRTKGESITFRYSYETGIETPTDLYDLQDAVGYMKSINELRWNDNGNKEGGEYPVHPKDLIENYASYMEKEPNKYYEENWRDLIFKKLAARQSHNVSISGGSKFVKSNASISYDDVDGLFANKKFQRVTARTNNDFTINRYISAILDINYNRRLFNNPSVDPLLITELMRPIDGAFWDDGRIATTANANPYGSLLYGGDKDETRDVIAGKAALNISPINGLKITAILAPSFSNTKIKTFNKQIPIYTADDPSLFLRYLEGNETTKLSEERNDTYSLTTQFFANYDKSFGIHNVSVMGGYENYYLKTEKLGASRDQYLHSNYPYLNIGPETFRDNSGSAYEQAYRSVFGRIAYNYNQRYLIQANIRYDGSSRFHRDYRWGVFPSFSAGWIVSEENFMKNQNTVSFLKLRASYGTLGNERVGNYPYQAIMNFGSSLFYQGDKLVSEGSASQQHYAIQDISWETTSSIDIGVDLHMFDNRLRFTGDIYYKETKDMLLALEIPDYVGFDNPQQNTGIMSTKGFDLDISWSDRINDFNYSVSANLSQFKSTMGDLGGTEFLGSQIKKEGSEFNEWYGYVSEGLYQTQEEVDASARLNNNARPGDIRYKDISGPDGVPDGKISAEYDRVLLGGSLPQYMFGGNIQLGYKGIDLSIVFQGVGKRNTHISTQIEPNVNNWGRFPVEILDGYWSHYNTPEQNANAKYPRFTRTNRNSNYTMSDFWMFNGGYFRVKNMTLGYTIPAIFTDRLLIKNLRFYVSANDLLSIDNFPKGIDPESGGRSSYPITSTFLGGVSITF